MTLKFFQCSYIALINAKNIADYFPSQVCKRWSNLILHPKYWRVFEVDFVRRRFNRPFGSDVVVQASIQPFIAKYCMNLIDCNLGLKRGSDGAFLLLNTLLQIKTLRRLSLRVDAGSFGGGASQSTNGETLVEPQCKDLVLLNLRQIALKPMELQNLLNVSAVTLKYIIPGK